MDVIKTIGFDGQKRTHATNTDVEYTLCGIAFDSRIDSIEDIEWVIDNTKSFPDNLLWSGKRITCESCLSLIKHIKENY